MTNYWMISYRYHRVHLLEGGVLVPNSSHDAVLMINEHPIAFLIGVERHEKEVVKRGYTGHGDADFYTKIERIYSMIEVPTDLSTSVTLAHAND